MTTHAEEALLFRIAGRDFALPLLRTREIVALPPLTPVPTTPPHILGAFNLVGRVVPVVDLARKLGLGQTGRHAKSYVVVADVVIGGENAVVGILVDELGGVVDGGELLEAIDLDAVMGER